MKARICQGGARNAEDAWYCTKGGVTHWGILTKGFNHETTGR